MVTKPPRIKTTVTAAKPSPTRHASIVGPPKVVVDAKLRARFRKLILRIESPSNPKKGPTADEVTAQLRIFHRLGKLINLQLGERGVYGDGTIARLAKSAGFSRGWVTKIRRFEQVYRDQEVFDKLCSVVSAITF